MHIDRDYCLSDASGHEIHPACNALLLLVQVTLGYSAALIQVLLHQVLRGMSGVVSIQQVFHMHLMK